MHINTTCIINGKLKIHLNLHPYKSFFRNILNEKYSGTAIHKISAKIAVVNPAVVPKKFLNTAPVYPMSAETSNLNNMIILLRSIGFKALIAIIGFSSG